MADQYTTEYQPDYVTSPGDTLQEILDERNLPQRQLAMRVGVTPKHINKIIKGQAGISASLALALEKTLGVPARFWLALDAKYQEHMAREREREELRQHIDWVKEFPLKKMVEWSYLPKYHDYEEALQHILRFFGVAHPAGFSTWWDGLQPSFRISLKKAPDQFALAAWLRQGERLASKADVPLYDTAKFANSLGRIRGLTLEPPNVFQPKLTSICAECGVIVAFVPELPRSYVCGATRWIGGNPLIQLSLRYKTDDMLWFAFFHEACHVLRHSRKTTYLQDGSGRQEDLEQQADRFAADKLIPPEEYQAFARPNLSESKVREFAHVICIAPGIVVGRLQHDGHLRQSYLNDLKVRLNWIRANL